MNNREISIARLNAKIYTQRNALINYQDLLQEKKAELAKVKQQLAIAVEGLEHFSECEDWNDPDFYIDKKEIADLADDYLKQIKELGK